MTGRDNKISAYFLLMILVIHFAGSHVIYLQQINRIYTDMKMTFSDTKVERIFMSEIEYEHAMLGDDEIKWNGGMYDVSKVIKSNHQVIVFVVQDYFEEALLRFMTTTEENADARSLLVQSLALMGIVPQQSIVDINGVVDGHHFTLYKKNYQQLKSDLVFPPPRA